MTAVIDKPIGGTEILKNKLHEVLGSELEDFNILVTNCYPKDLKEDKVNVLWQHNNIDDQNMVKMMQYKPLVENIDHFVFVSHYHYDVFAHAFKLPSDKCHVIRNAITPIPFKEKKRDGKIKLIYTSTPWRGLGILLEAFSRLNRDDVELDVFSSTKIYGKDFAKETGDMFEPLFERARSMKNVNYKEYAPNDEVKQACQDAHIMAYPSVFAETSCLAAIEAMAAGCKFVGSNLGALPETTACFADLVPIGRLEERRIEEFIDRYTEVLNEAIDNYWSDETQDTLKMQVEYFNKYYSWDYRKREWQDFLKKARNEFTKSK